MNRTKLTYTPTKRKSTDAVDIICFMLIGIGILLAVSFDIVLASPNQMPWLTLLLGFIGVICLFLPSIIASLED